MASKCCGMAMKEPDYRPDTISGGNGTIIYIGPSTDNSHSGDSPSPFRGLGHIIEKKTMFYL